MTVQQLIEELQTLDPTKPVKFHSYIETGRGGSWITVEDFDIEEEDSTYIFSISGDEEEDGGYD